MFAFSFLRIKPQVAFRIVSGRGSKGHYGLPSGRILRTKTLGPTNRIWTPAGFASGRAHPCATHPLAPDYRSGIAISIWVNDLPSQAHPEMCRDSEKGEIARIPCRGGISKAGPGLSGRHALAGLPHSTRKKRAAAQRRRLSQRFGPLPASTTGPLQDPRPRQRPGSLDRARHSVTCTWSR